VLLKFTILVFCAGIACSNDKTQVDEEECPPLATNLHHEMIGSVVVIDAAAPILDGDRILAKNLANYVSTQIPFGVDQIFVWTSGWRAANLNGGPHFIALDAACSPQLSGVSMMGEWNLEDSSFAVLAQEFSHQWLAHALFVDPVTGETSDEMLGRDDNHWSALLDSDGSFQDGVDWSLNFDGRFNAGMKARK
jgi:hypothetical protein